MKNDRPAADQAVSAKSTRLVRLGAAASVAVLVLGLIGLGAARGQVNPLQIIALALGSSDENGVQLHVNGPSDVLQTLLVFQAGAATGWHTHPGPVVVVVKSGALTEIHSNGCVTVHPAGSAFFETKGEVHNALNQTAGLAEVYATFLSPAGAQFGWLRVGRLGGAFNPFLSMASSPPYRAVMAKAISNH